MVRGVSVCVCVCICPYVAVIPLAVDSNGYRNVVIFLIKQTHIKKKDIQQSKPNENDDHWKN